MTLTFPCEHYLLVCVCKNTCSLTQARVCYVLIYVQLHILNLSSVISLKENDTPMMRLILLLAFLFAGFTQAQQTGTTQVMHWTVDGTEREALVYIPTAAKSRISPVVFVFHGHGGNMQEMFRGHNFDKLWPEAIVIVPQGLKTPGQLVDREGNYSGWQQGSGDMNDRDIHFFDAMLHTLTKDYQIDSKRIYATGHSNGGSFTYLLWAMRGDVFAAVAPSAAVALRYKDMLKPKPVLHIMGETDPLVKPAWQKLNFNMLLKLNNCSNRGETFTDLATLYPSTSNTPVVLYEHPGGHVYPQEANAVAVQFFKKIVKP